jgi:hypothetical protein
MIVSYENNRQYEEIWLQQIGQACSKVKNILTQLKCYFVNVILPFPSPTSFREMIQLAFVMAPVSSSLQRSTLWLTPPAAVDCHVLASDSTAKRRFSFVLMLHLLFPYNVFLLHQTILTQNTQCTIKHHTPTHIHFTTFTVKLYNSKHTHTQTEHQ